MVDSICCDEKTGYKHYDGVDGSYHTRPVRFFVAI